MFFLVFLGVSWRFFVVIGEFFVVVGGCRFFLCFFGNFWLFLVVLCGS